MDNQLNSSEGAWVDGRLAAMVPPDNWHPDARRAFAQFKTRPDQPQAAASPRWIQFLMAAALLVSIGLVVTLIPWNALWSGPKKVVENRISQPAEAAPTPTPPVTPGQPKPLVASTVAALQQPTPPSQEQTPAGPVGSGVTPPRLISSPEPNYSDEARQEHIQGTIILSVTFRADGTAKVDKVVQGLGHGLDEKAIEAVEKWRFVPAMKDGQPVDVQMPVKMNFKLY